MIGNQDSGQLIARDCQHKKMMYIQVKDMVASANFPAQLATLTIALLLCT